MLEYVGPKYRTLTGNLSLALFYTLGTTALPWIAWAVADWRLFSLITSVPMLSVLAAYWIIPESARYHFIQQSEEFSLVVWVMAVATGSTGYCLRC